MPSPKRRRVTGSWDFADVLSSWLSCGWRRYGKSTRILYACGFKENEILSSFFSLRYCFFLLSWWFSLCLQAEVLDYLT